jgi:hypothetical protein
MNRRELEEKLIDQAWQDAAFKQELLSNPKLALEKEGIKLPANIEVRVVEETPTTLYMVIPINPNQKELSDAELSRQA